MKRVVTIGVYIMIVAVLSALVTTPLGSGMASGILFVSGMLLAWLGGLLTIGRWIARRCYPNRNRS